MKYRDHVLNQTSWLVIGDGTYDRIFEDRWIPGIDLLKDQPTKHQNPARVGASLRKVVDLISKVGDSIMV